MQDIFSVEKKVVLITGGAGGIGKSLVKGFISNGAIVYSLDFSYKKKVSCITANLFEVKVDITNEKDVRKIFKNIYKQQGRIDTLINCAGVTRIKKDIKKMYPLSDWEYTIKTNLTGAFVCSQMAVEQMLKKKEGSIINITSLNAEKGFPNNPAYVASKGGLKMLTKSLARDWGIYGIRANNIGPGYIKTDMTLKSYLNKKTRLKRQSNTVVGRWGNPEDLIGAALFLASDASTYITGIDLYVDGGWMSNGLQLEI